MPAQRTTRNSAKTTSLSSINASLSFSQPNGSQRGKYVRTKIVSDNTAATVDRIEDTGDIIEGSQEPAAGQQFDSQFDSQFVIERDTCQMSPLLFDSDSDSDANESPDAVPIANNQQQQAHQLHHQHHRIANASPSLPLSSSPPEMAVPSSSEPLLDLPTSTTETDTDLSQPPAKANTDASAPAGVVARRRTSFRSFKCAPARLTRLAALRNERLQATAPPPAQPPVATMHPPRLKPAAAAPVASCSYSHPKQRASTAKRLRPAYPSSSSEFSVASDISVAMTARRNVISGDSEELNPVRPAYEAYEPCTARRHQHADTGTHNLSVLPVEREPSTSQELQLIEHKSVIITLSSSTDEGSRSQQRQFGCTPRRSTQGAHRRRSPDLFDTYDGDEVVPTLPRRTMSFFDPPRASFFARLNSQAASLAAASGGTPKRRPTPSRVASAQARRRDESIDIFGDNATFIETPHRPAQLVIDETSASASVTLTPQQHQHRDTSTNPGVFEITKNDVFPHLIRLTSDSDMSPIKMSDDEQQLAAGNRSAFKLPATSTPVIREHFVDPDVNDTGVIAASQDAQEQMRTPNKLTLYERLCRTDPSRQFGIRRRRKAGAPRTAADGSQSVIRTPERKRVKSAGAATATAAETSTGTSQERKTGAGGARLQKWGSDERSTKWTKPAWTGRRLDDYFAKASTSSSGTTTAQKSEKAAKAASSEKPKASFQLLVLSSDDD